MININAESAKICSECDVEDGHEADCSLKGQTPILYLCNVTSHLTTPLGPLSVGTWILVTATDESKATKRAWEIEAEATGSDENSDLTTEVNSVHYVPETHVEWVKFVFGEPQ